MIKPDLGSFVMWNGSNGRHIVFKVLDFEEETTYKLKVVIDTAKEMPYGLETRDDFAFGCWSTVTAADILSGVAWGEGPPDETEKKHGVVSLKQNCKRTLK